MNQPNINQQVNVALIGYGMAGLVHGPLIDFEPDLNLTHIVTSNSQRQHSARQRHPNADTSLTLEQVINSDDVDLIVISTPNTTHFAIASAALEAGKHVVLEKPVTNTVDELDKLSEIAANYGRLLIPFHNRRWDADFLTVKKVMPKLGRINRFISRFHRYVPDVSNGWREQPEPGAGVLYDLGSHLIDQAIVLFGKPHSVNAVVEKQRANAQVEDYFDLRFSYDGFSYDGLEVELEAGYMFPERGPRFEVVGELGAFVKYGTDLQPTALTNGMKPDDPHWGVENPDFYGVLTVNDEQQTVESERGSLQTFYRQVALAINDGEPVPVSVADARTGLEIIEYALAI